MTWIITRELNLFCNPEEIGDFFWANLFALESFKVIHCSVINVLCCFQQLRYIIIIICACQQLFLFYFVHHLMSERRRRDLNPRAAINDLHPFQGCPFGQLGYFSEYITRYLIRSLKISNSIVFLMSGEEGIRTHVPLRTNGFQDRLVMTTSIPLRVLVSNQCRNNITICFHQCQHFFSLFLFKYNSAAIMSSGVVIFRFW